MPRLPALTFIVLSLPVPIYCEEIALIDSKGEYAAYMTENGVIYLWEGGKPPAYSEKESIYSFDGKHLGWFFEGYIIDRNGYKVGAIEGVVRSKSLIKPLKGIKGIVPLKSLKRMAPMKPQVRSEWSITPLGIFLKTGISSEKGESALGFPDTDTLLLIQKVIKLEQILSDSEYKSCGLHKLTDVEIANLEKVIATVIQLFIKTMQEQRQMSPRGSSIQTYGGTGSGHWVSKNIDSGKLIKLEDGSLWEISSIDRINTMLWLATEQITITKSGNSPYPYKLINVDQENAAEAKLVSK